MSPNKKYTTACNLVDLSGIADFTPVDTLPGPRKSTLIFSPTMYKHSVPDSWSVWGSPPDTEDSTPHILYTTVLSL